MNYAANMMSLHNLQSILLTKFKIKEKNTF
jgi:hypothetical protein